ncbi:MAG: phosphoglycerate mutase family protein [Candidatus Paceibacterota bacterium]
MGAFQDIFFLRHGMSDEGCEGLNKKGIEQMEEAGNFLKGKFPVSSWKIYTSPGPRAKESGKLVSRILDCEVDEGALLFKPKDETTLVLHEVLRVLAELRGVEKEKILIITNGKFLKDVVAQVSNTSNIQIPSINFSRGSANVIWIENSCWEFKEF